MQPLGGHLCFDLVTARHNETLGERIESAHDCKTDKNSKKFGNSSRNWTDSLQRFRLGSLSYVWSMKGWFYWSNAVTWCITWNYQSADRRLSSEEKGTICLYSNVIPTGEEDTTKLKKVTITSSKREKNKTKKKHKQKKAAKLHVSPGCQPTSRWGPPPHPPSSFSLCRNLTRSCPHHLNSALSFLVL